MGSTLPDDVLERSLVGLDAASIGCCCTVSSRWRIAAEQNSLWLAPLTDCAKHLYRTAITEEGANAWVDRELGGEIMRSRCHLQRLQQSRQLKHLFHFLRNCHNGVVVERRDTSWRYHTSGASISVSMELLNFWPHDSWVWLRSAPQLEPEESRNTMPSDLKLQGSARIRCWDNAQLPPGRLGDGLCFMLDCKTHGEFFRLPPLSNLEIGCHELVGHANKVPMRLECAMGKWPEDISIPLPACSADAFLHSSTAATVTCETQENGHTIFQDLHRKWLSGSSLPENCNFGPILYRTLINLNMP